MSRRFKFPEYIALVASLTPAWVFAQACCAGSSAVTPGRLALHEDSAVGVTARAADALGSFSPDGRYVASPGSDYEVDLEQDMFASVRLFERGQLSAVLPFVETLRGVPTINEAGGGIGDVNVAARWDFVNAGQYRRWPGVAVLVGVTAPTGTPPELARHTLATDATGVGSWQLSGGLALEQTFGAWLIGLSGFLSGRLPRDVNGVREQLGLQYTALGTLAYTFKNEIAVGLSFSYVGELAAVIDGATAGGTQRALPTLSGFLGAPLGDDWRIAGSAICSMLGFGQNQSPAIGATLTLVRVWL